ncbi:MAG: septum formation protein Maf [Oscillospiraceae bacterium]|nr:septum formation protein Maf [Oscillospiraceae bacterium]
MLENINVILASKSPRRRELMEFIKHEFEIIPSLKEEVVPEGLDIEDIPAFLAAQKALDISRDRRDSLVIGCDTVVTLGGVIMGKPSDETDAKAMLMRLSGRTHTVISGVCLCYMGRTMTFTEKTSVTFYDLTEDEIDSYIASGSPLDKAGAYGIQDGAALFVKKIDGDYYNVVGLPVAKLAREIKTLIKLV